RHGFFPHHPYRSVYLGAPFLPRDTLDAAVYDRRSVVETCRRQRHKGRRSNASSVTARNRDGLVRTPYGGDGSLYSSI
ncbi:hypothetical protein EDD18DRAFT_1470531, partial [Armillaria luteobubalina]